VADLSRFFIALLNDGVFEEARILDRSSVEEMLRFQYVQGNQPGNVSLQEVNSGLFWQTKFNVTRIGHGGSDPGVRTWMLADLSKSIGVVMFTNTSLSAEDMRHHVAIFLELWKHAEALKRRGQPFAGGAGGLR
jgi:CubicO group peptidase (beta-lactamase class C family)